VPAKKASSEPGDLWDLTRGRHSEVVNNTKGVFYYKPIEDPKGVRRIPAFLLHSNNLRGLSERNPWLDVVEPDDGYALYHGDNRTPGGDWLKTIGNRTLWNQYNCYVDPRLRALAAPILLFESTPKPETSGSFRRFAGYGVPREIRFQTQHTSAGTFTNLVMELVLFSLTSEGELLDWEWIDQRRDAALTAEKALGVAPAAWQRWVKGGESVLETTRRRVYRADVRSPVQQKADLSVADEKTLNAVYRFFNTKSNAYAFEGLASMVANRVLRPSSSRGWVTPRVDGGIDFVNRLDLGSGFAKTSVVVLGQAKCVDPNKSVSGIDLARTVARLKRGWIGAVVTTGTFSVKAQQEASIDQYPLILINGARLAMELHNEMTETGLTLEALLEREVAWYDKNQRVITPDRIAYGDHWGEATD
jgi:hypothetical protein